MIDGRLHDSLAWQKAMASVPGGMCVEVAECSGGVAVRDSKCPEQGALMYSKAEFAAFVDGCRQGEFDHLL
ncbi:DUF397 domain-containing protein [Actinomycetospora atypica]|uniref:DUF397 domain-containing protein n=1 Tax=Actinomycetospora atypica TaxID=1290095 RepID=A0ABV9YRB4_9PSEU